MAPKKTGKRQSGKPLWTAVDQYLGGLFAPHDEHQDAALKANRKAKLPAIDVSPLQGKFLEFLINVTQAKRVLEIGLLGGYSTMWSGQRQPETRRLIEESRHSRWPRS